MYQMTTKIYEALKQNGNLKVFTEEASESSAVWLQFGIKNGGSYRIRFISTDNDNDVAVRVYSLVSVEESKRANVLTAINKLNRKYRFVKFNMDDDGDVNVEYDYLVNDPDPSASAMELIIRLVKIIDDTYPELMRAMWA